MKIKIGMNPGNRDGDEIKADPHVLSIKDFG